MPSKTIHHGGAHTPLTCDQDPDACLEAHRCGELRGVSKEHHVKMQQINYAKERLHPIHVDSPCFP